MNPGATPAEAAGALRAALVAVADPDKAGPMGAYLKDRFACLGVLKPARLAATRDLVRALPVTGAAWLHDLARRLWALPEREHQYVAVDVLKRHARVLVDGSLPALRDLVVTKSWWDSVDALAPVIGRGALDHPAWAPALWSWATDDDLWLRRVAIIHQLGRGTATDLPRLTHAIEANLDDGEFFLRKAIGWSLRDLARHEPAWVATFVATHPTLSALSRREALKHLGEIPDRTATARRSRG